MIFFITCQTKIHNGIFGTWHIFDVSSNESVNIIIGTNVNWTLHRCTCEMTSITADTKDIEAINPDSTTMITDGLLRFLFSLSLFKYCWMRSLLMEDWLILIINQSELGSMWISFSVLLQWSHTIFGKIDELMNGFEMSMSKDIYTVQTVFGA